MEKSEQMLYKYCYFCNFIYQGFHQCPNIEEFKKFVQYINFIEMSKIYKEDILKFEKDLKANKMAILTTTSTTSMSSSLSKTINISQNNNRTLVSKKNFKIKSLDKELNRYDSNSISRKIKTITTSTTASNNNSKNIIKPSPKMVEGKQIEPAASATVVGNNTLAYSTTKTGGDTFDAAAITKDKRTILGAASENKNKITPFRKCLKDNSGTKLYSKCINKEKRVNNNNKEIKVDEIENVEQQQQRDEEELVGAVGGGSSAALEPKVIMEENDGQTDIKENIANSTGSNNCKNNHNGNFENQLMQSRMINSFQHCPYQNSSNMNNYTSTQPILPNGFINNDNNYTNAQQYHNNIPMQFPLSTMRFQYNPSINQAQQHNIKHQQYHPHNQKIRQQQQQQQQLPNQQKTTNQQKKSFNTSSYAGISLQMPPPSINLQQAPPPLPPPIQPPTFYYLNCYSNNYEYYDQNNINENNYYNMYNNHGYYSGMRCHPNVPNPPFLHNTSGASTTYHNNPNNNHRHEQSTFRENCYKAPISNNTTYYNKQASPQKHYMLDEDKSTISPNNNTTSTSENEDFNLNQRKPNTDVDTNLIEENLKKCSSVLENLVKSHLVKCEKDKTNCEKLKTNSTMGESSSAVAAEEISSSKPKASSSSKEASSSKESSSKASSSKESSSLSPYEPSKRIYVGRTNNYGTTFNGERKDEVTHFSMRYIIETIVELKKDIAELQSSLGIIKN